MARVRVSSEFKAAFGYWVSIFSNSRANIIFLIWRDVRRASFRYPFGLFIWLPLSHTDNDSAATYVGKRYRRFCQLRFACVLFEIKPTLVLDRKRFTWLS